MYGTAASAFLKVPQAITPYINGNENTNQVTKLKKRI
jgi:hypothetical protein